MSNGLVITFTVLALAAQITSGCGQQKRSPNPGIARSGTPAKPAKPGAPSAPQLQQDKQKAGAETKPVDTRILPVTQKDVASDHTKGTPSMGNIGIKIKKVQTTPSKDDLIFKLTLDNGNYLLVATKESGGAVDSTGTEQEKAFAEKYLKKDTSKAVCNDSFGVTQDGQCKSLTLTLDLKNPTKPTVYSEFKIERTVVENIKVTRTVVTPKGSAVEGEEPKVAGNAILITNKLVDGAESRVFRHIIMGDKNNKGSLPITHEGVPSNTDGRSVLTISFFLELGVDKDGKAYQVLPANSDFRELPDKAYVAFTAQAPGGDVVALRFESILSEQGSDSPYKSEVAAPASTETPTDTTVTETAKTENNQAAQAEPTQTQQNQEQNQEQNHGQQTQTQTQQSQEQNHGQQTQTQQNQEQNQNQNQNQNQQNQSSTTTTSTEQNQNTVTTPQQRLVSERQAQPTKARPKTAAARTHQVLAHKDQKNTQTPRKEDSGKVATSSASSQNDAPPRATNDSDVTATTTTSTTSTANTESGKSSAKITTPAPQTRILDLKGTKDPFPNVGGTSQARRQANDIDSP